MKRPLLFITLAAALVNSCDYVEVPQPNNGSSAAVNCPVPVFPAITNHIRRVLLEDYTGHTCGNCPPAAAQAATLLGQYQDSLIVVAVHTGYYGYPCPPAAPPAGAGATDYQYDYRTMASKDYDDKFGMQLLGLPQGMVSRIDYASGGICKSWGNWAAKVDSLVQTPPQAELQVINNYNLATRKLCTHIRFEALAPLPDDYKLVVMLIQDSISDYQLVGATTTAGYMHRHMIRDIVNVSGNTAGEGWGTVLGNNFATGDTLINSYGYNVPSDISSFLPVPPSPTVPATTAVTIVDAAHCYIVAFIYNATLGSPTEYQVIQAAEAKLY